MCLGFLATLFGCNKDKYILDGPGMINPDVFDKITVSRSCYSEAQLNFNLELTVTDDGWFINGDVCRVSGVYEPEDAIPIPANMQSAIMSLRPNLLPDVAPTELFSEEESIIPDGGEVLDRGNVEIEILYADGRRVEKVDKDDFSIMLYNIVLPLFEEKYN